MRSVRVAVIMIMGCWMASAASATGAAESKPLNDLPTDLTYWSTMWVEVPRQMYGVGQEEGPIAAMTWGPVRGTVMLVNATTKALWDAAKPETRPAHQSRNKQLLGPMLRYEF